ncbi:acyltransferase [Microbacterium sp. NPDC089189]|uniref:acyltransferase n=1 Tax=Microbacterium sp. NPDC089189 TaxID=3154972 RepID=UPI00343B182C
MSSPSLTPTARHGWMDVLRGVAILGVLLVHSVNLASMLSDVKTPQLLDDVNAALLPYRMPMLFILSGMLLSRSLRKSRSVYYLGKLRNLVWPYLVWVSIYWLVTWPPVAPAWYEWFATSWLWYLSYLTLYFLVAPLLTRVPVWVVPILAWAVSHVAPDPVITDLFLYAGYFFAGSAIWQYRSWALRLDRLVWVIVGAVAAIALSAAYIAQQHGAVFLVPLRREELMYAPLTVIGIGGLILIARRLPSGATRLVSYLGRNSIVFYLVHFPVQILIAQMLAVLALRQWQLHVGLGVIIPFLLGVLLVRWRRHRVVDAFFALPRVRWRRAYTAG